MWIAKLKDLKKKCNVTYMDIAEACSVSRVGVSKWFNGEFIPETKYIDIMHDKFFSEMCTADCLEALFSHTYEEKHNVDGQISISELAKEEQPIVVVPVKLRLPNPRYGLVSAYYDRQRELIYTSFISTELAIASGWTWEEENDR